MKNQLGLQLAVIFSFYVTIASSPTLAAAQVQLDAYYSSVDESNASTLRTTLHEVIDDHTAYPYTSSGTDTWDILEQADVDPNDPTHILDIYKNESYRKQGGGNNNYQREHVWPSSYGFPQGGYPYTDCHQLHLANGSYNNARGNNPFDYCDASCREYPTLGAASGTYPADSNWGSGFQNTWETWSQRKGDIARTMFYMDIRYEGGIHNVTGRSEPDLRLTDNRSLITTSSSNQSVAYMGLLSVLFAWHQSDPVDDLERNRNEIVYSYQGNRNPFVDHPEWVACIYQNLCEADIPGPPPPLAAPWFNEIHYDNTGLDRDEGIEIAGPAGMDLDGWTIACYNGRNTSVYRTVQLSGSIENQRNGFGSLWFDIEGLQNGSPDGIALVDPEGQAIEFLSYEGTITAISGPAAGMTSADLGVAEDSCTPVGSSLQRIGRGEDSAAFTWSLGDRHSRGEVNEGQEFEQ